MAGVITYDDLLVRLRAALADQIRGPAACRRLSERYDVVLVDEFQDTDPVQWEILERAFGRSTLVLIGDPKQAIYSFRGADVYAYLAAAQSATQKATLDTNWRSDQKLIDAYDALFADVQLGHPGITYHPVHAAQGNIRTGLVNAPSCLPLRIRILDRRKVGLTNRGCAKAPEAQRRIARDLASDVTSLLSSEASVSASRGNTDGELVPIGPGDIAVLVRTNRQAGCVRDALHESGVPAVVAGGGSVFESAAATDWLRLLTAIDKPTSRRLASAAALTHFVGWNAARVASAGDDDWEELHWRLARWSSILRGRGVAPLLEYVSSAGLPARVLSLPSGERLMTDLLHIGRLLHAAAVEQNLGSAALTGWLKRRIAEAGEDRDDEDRSLRLESDAEAVQVLTIHRSKGLEFPVVYCPFLWHGWEPKVPVPVFHDPDNDDALTVDVGGERVGFTHHQRLHQQEQRGEDLRLLYVALTRAATRPSFGGRGRTTAETLHWAGFCSLATPMESSSRKEDGRRPMIRCELIWSRFRRDREDASAWRMPTGSSRPPCNPPPRSSWTSRPLYSIAYSTTVGAETLTRASLLTLITLTIRGWEASRTRNSLPTSLSSPWDRLPVSRGTGGDSDPRRSMDRNRPGALSRRPLSSFRRCLQEWRPGLSSTVCSS